MPRVLTIAAIGGALALAGCGDDDSSDSGSSDSGSSDSGSSGSSLYGGGAGTEQAGGQPATDQKAAGTTIALGDSQFGPVLFDGDDQAIYVFDRESGPTSECYGACAEAWPPVLTGGDPQPAGGVKGGLLGITEREDGSAQATYKGQPLYYYAHEGPGEVTCHDVAEFGGLWLAIDASGNSV